MKLLGISSAALCLFMALATTANGFAIIPSSSSSTSSSVLFYESSSADKLDNRFIVSPVLQQVYPKLLEWKQEYGHPNIPLGTPEGRKCATLRRLHIQQKLTQEEVEWLQDLGFLFHSLEDVYEHADFDDLFERLMDYEARHPESNFQVPKKCAEDPELGAWVTGLRRLGADKVDPKHAQQLNNVGFAWFSKSKCGSKFMLQYKALTQLVKEMENDGKTKAEAIQIIIAEDPKVKALVQAQKQIEAKGTMSETRMNYMNQLFGDEWTTLV
ncbi:unnamed protein product [Cylindrotheca closterium]|uniref:Helicase-associated domain-containing protein n=1 Tax=Cylindrotheca closterium TaxID=2856 RepID=A0AAD2CZD0_9STRA|nr:unnamed protein product [Cylindrotheca closterium]